MTDPGELFRRIGYWGAPCCTDPFNRSAGAESAPNQNTSSDQTRAADSLPTMDNYVLSFRQFLLELFYQANRFPFGTGYVAVNNRERPKLNRVNLARLLFALKIEVLDFVRCQH